MHFTSQPSWKYCLVNLSRKTWLDHFRSQVKSGAGSLHSLHAYFICNLASMLFPLPSLKRGCVASGIVRIASKLTVFRLELMTNSWERSASCKLQEHKLVQHNEPKKAEAFSLRQKIEIVFIQGENYAPKVLGRRPVYGSRDVRNELVHIEERTRLY